MKPATKPVTTDAEPRVKPDESAYREAQRNITERNDQARKEGKDRRAAQERELAAQKAARERGVVYR
jgi:type IV secretory pathway VirB10-like protein